MSAVELNFVASPVLNRPPNSRHYYRALSPISCLHRAEIGMRQIQGISEIAKRYDAILLDQFGVIHDGQTAYPRALHAIDQLYQRGLKVVIVSNSSRQSKHAAEKLTKMGVDTQSIHGIITSGQLALGAMKDLMSRSPQAQVLHFNWTSSRGSLSLQEHGIHNIAPLTRSIDRVNVPSPESVDLILAHGTDAITTSHEEVQDTPFNVLRDLCREIAQEKPSVPFYCANPDMVTVDGPQLRVMPGTLAKEFEDAGGKCVHRLGKPDVVAYNAASELLGISDRRRILAIGDSLGHDILGAANAGIDSLYVAGGINAAHFGINPAHGFKGECSWHWSTSAFEALVAQEAPTLGKRRPTFVSPFFRW